MTVIGLTGSIGMGKSTTATLFAEAGVPVYDADAVVHRLYDGEAAPLIEAAFPGSTTEGRVDRARLAAQVIGDAAAIRRLEAIIHPLVHAAEDEFLRDQRAAGQSVVVLDIPLLMETEGDRRVDVVVVVSAPAAIQRERVLARPGMTDEKFDALLERQVSDSDKRRRADFVVDTSQGLDHARAQVRDILARVATMARHRP